jgi:hypothetical protein
LRRRHPVEVRVSVAGRGMGHLLLANRRHRKIGPGSPVAGRGGVLTTYSIIAHTIELHGGAPEPLARAGLSGSNRTGALALPPARLVTPV